MPRIRSIKPEFWTSGQVLECSTNARLLFIGLWNFCDDEGRHAMRTKQIKAEVFPADDFTADDILGMIDELAANDLITLYEHEAQRFFQVNGWHHQRIDKPQAPKFPDPFDEHSTIIRGTLPPDRKGKERKGRERRGEGASGDASPPPKNQASKPDDIDDQTWSDFLAHRRAKKAKLTPTAWKQIRKQLDIGIAKGHDPNDMLAVAMASGWQGFQFEWYANRIAEKPQTGTGDNARSALIEEASRLRAVR